MTQTITPAELERLATKIADAVFTKLSNQQRLVDRQALAAIVGLSVPTIDRRVRAGEIPCIKSGKRVLFDPAAVVAALSSGNSIGGSQQSCMNCENLLPSESRD